VSSGSDEDGEGIIVGQGRTWADLFEVRSREDFPDGLHQRISNDDSDIRTRVAEAESGSEERSQVSKPSVLAWLRGQGKEEEGCICLPIRRIR
jgi:hypothetical protein